MAEFKLARLRFSWLGDWQTGTAYARDSIVHYQGKAYTCLVPHTSTIFDTDLATNDNGVYYWSLLADGKTWRGAWTPGTTYSLGNIVTYGGAVYSCTTANIASLDFASDQTKWSVYAQADKFERAWQPNTSYGIGDIVNYGGIVYRATADHTSSATTVLGLENDIGNWAIFDKSAAWAGAWTTGARYKAQDLVRVNADVWICTQGHTAGATFDQTKFTIYLPGEGYLDTWSASTTYQLGDTATYGGYEYISTIASNLNIIPSTAATEWTIVTTGYKFKGPWTLGSQYKIGDVVSINGDLYIATADNNSVNPTDGAVPVTYVPSGSSGTTFNVSFTTGTGVGLAVGQFLNGTGFSTGQTITAISSLTSTTATLTLSHAPDATPSGLYSAAGIYVGYWALLTAIGQNWKGIWMPGILYIYGDIVVWKNATYRCTHKNTSTLLNRPDLDLADGSADFWSYYLIHAGRNAGATVGDLTTFANGATTSLPIGPNTYTLRATNNLPGWRSIMSVPNVYYVDAATGVDATTYGTTIDTPWKSIKYACDTLLAGTQNLNASYLITQNREFIVAEMYQWMLYQKAQSTNGFTPSSTFDQTKTLRDARYVIDAIAYDLTRGGNSQTVAATLAYFSNSTTFINTTVAAEIVYFKAALVYLTTLVGNVLANTPPAVNYQTLNAVASPVTQLINASIEAETGSTTPAANSTITVANNGSIAWTVSGSDNVGLNLIRGNTYTFNITTSGYAFWIQTTGAGYNAGSVYNTGVTANGSSSGQVTFTVPYSAPSKLYYQSGASSIMYGTFNIYDSTATITNAPSAQSATTTLLSILNTALANQSTAAVPAANSGITASIFVKTGTYSETLPITIPENVAVIGDELRGVVVQPKQIVNTLATLSNSDNTFTVTSTAGMTDNMQVQFAGTTFGGVVAGSTYYVIGSTITPTTFSVTAVSGSQNAVPLTATFGSMRVYGGDALKNMFLMRNGTGLRNMTLTGLLGTLTAANQYLTARPTGGAYTSLDPGAGPNDTKVWIFRRSPYVQNVTTFGQGCVGCKIDGTLHNGGNKSIVSNDFTQILSDGIGVWCTGSGALTELVSVFTYYNYSGYFAEAGGRIRATNGNSSYGVYGVVAEGYDVTETPLVGTVFNKSQQVQATVQSSYGVNAQLLKIAYANAGSGYTSTTTNLLKYSNTFTNAAWTNDGNLTLQENVIATTGYAEGWTMTGGTSVTDSSYIYQNISILKPASSYTGLTGTNIQGSGNSATFDVVVGSTSYSATINNPGTGYVSGNTIAILGSTFGGTDGVNDLTITVTGIGSGGSPIATISVQGTVPTNSNKKYVFSVYAKKGTSNSFDMYATWSGSSTNTSAVSYNFTTNTITPYSAAGSAFVATAYGAVPISNNWYRIWFTAYDITAQNTNLQFRLYPRGANGNAGSTIFYGAQVQTDATGLSFYQETAAVPYTSYANFGIYGSGSGAVVVGDEIRSQSVFQTSIGSGGSGYLTASNNAQGGNNYYVTLAQSDTNTASNYYGMRVFLTSGTGTGQYGIISAYTPATKIAQVIKESITPIVVTSTNTAGSNYFGLAAGNDTTQLYVNQMVQFIPTTYSNTVTQTSYGTFTIVSTTGGDNNFITVASTASLQVNMPITFIGNVLPAANLTSNFTYYVSSISNNGTDFQISTTLYGSAWPLGTSTGGWTASFSTNTGYLYGAGATTNMAINLPVVFTGTSLGGVSSATTYYINDIIDASTFTISNSLITVVPTATTSSTNIITVPSTTGLSTFNPIVFSGTTFGNIVAGTKYYVNRVIDSTTFSIVSSLIQTTATATQIGTNLITVTSTAGFVVNQPIVFTGTTFGNIVAETVYYVLAINNSISFTISTVPGGSPFSVSTQVGSCIVRTAPANFTLTSVTSNTMTGTTTSVKRLVTKSLGSMTATVSTSLFGGSNITAGTIYYVLGIYSNAFTVTDTSGGSTAVTLSTGTGSMSMAAVGWDHIIPGTTSATLLDTSTQYFVEPRAIYAAPPYSSTATTILTPSGGASYSSVAYGENAWIAIPNTGTSAAKSVDGVNWTSVVMPSSASWTDIKYGNSYWVAIANGTTAAYSQSTGAGWRTSTLPANTLWTYLAYGAGTFVAITNNGANCAYSTNYGGTWQSGNSLPNAYWRAMCYGAGKFVAVANTGGNSAGTQAAYSLDGITWVSVTLPVSAIWASVTYGNGRFVATASSSALTVYSFDGITWTGSNLSITATTVVYGQGTFLAFNTTGTTSYISDDGITWQQKTIPSTSYTTAAFGFKTTSSDGVFVLVGGQNSSATVSAGVKTKGRAVVTSGTITSVNEWEPGSGYTSAPAVTFNDPNATTLAVATARTSNGTLSNPTILNRGIGYSANTTYIVITGNGYANAYQTGYTLTVLGLARLPSPGDNLTITGLSTVYKVTSAAAVFGTTAPNIEANLQINPNISSSESPEDGTAISIRTKYSQVRLTNHDFLNIGYGNFDTANYPNAPANGFAASYQNQTAENNYGRVFFTSTDQDGNFKVGNLFGVQQATGIVTVSVTQFGLSGLNSLNLGGIAVGGTSVVITQFSTDATFAANSDSVVPTQKAVKSYIASRLSQGGSNTNTGQLIAGSITVGNPQTIGNQVPVGIPGSSIKMPTKVVVKGPGASWAGGGAALQYFAQSWQRRGL
jgi:hypothetical protein